MLQTCTIEFREVVNDRKRGRMVRRWMIVDHSTPEGAERQGVLSVDKAYEKDFVPMKRARVHPSDCAHEQAKVEPLAHREGRTRSLQMTRKSLTLYPIELGGHTSDQSYTVPFYGAGERTMSVTLRRIILPKRAKGKEPKIPAS
jgi:hypothetical protein